MEREKRGGEMEGEDEDEDGGARWISLYLKETPEAQADANAHGELRRGTDKDVLILPAPSCSWDCVSLMNGRA